MSNPIEWRIDDGVARITLNRPESMNAFDEAMSHEWSGITRDIVSRKEVRAVLLSGNGRGFCAGGDVRAMASGDFDGEALERLANTINEGQLSLLESEVPVIAAAHGTTAGGGLGILLASDYAIIESSSKIGSLYAKLGLTPDLTVTSLLVRAVGERRALQLVLRDRLLPSSEALDWGLVAEVVPDGEVLVRGEELAREIASNAGWARGQAKRLIRAAHGRSLRESMLDEARTIGAALETAEAQSRTTVFAGK